VFGTSVITAVTAQNPCEVRGIYPLPPEAVKEQLESVFAKFAVKAAKTGMLHNRGVVEATARFFEGRGIPLIVDPVMIASSGAPLIDDEAADALTSCLFPAADWILPNIPEAEKILGRTINSVAALKEAATEIAEKYSCSCIVKGGHLADDDGNAVDAVCANGRISLLSSERISIPDERGMLPHGTGCTFSSALTAGIALGLPLKDVLIGAKAFVLGSLAESVQPGKGLYAMYPPAGAYRDKITLSE